MPRFQRLRDWYTRHSAKLVPAALAVGTLVGGAFKPLIEQTLPRLVFHEQARLSVETDKPIARVGEEIAVRVLVIPEGRIPLSTGSLRFQFDRQALGTRDSTVFAYAGSDKASAFPESAPLKLIPHSPGTFQITAALQTSRGNFSTAKQIIVSPASAPGAVSDQNFSGQWQIHLGGMAGVMSLVQDGTTVAGSFRLDNNIQGSFRGLRDGFTFRVDFLRIAPTNKWVIDATWQTRGDFIEITGKARPMHLSGSDFVSDGPETSFLAVGRTY